MEGMRCPWGEPPAGTALVMELGEASGTPGSCLVRSAQSLGHAAESRTAPGPSAAGWPDRAASLRVEAWPQWPWALCPAPHRLHTGLALGQPWPCCPWPPHRADRGLHRYRCERASETQGMMQMPKRALQCWTLQPEAPAGQPGPGRGTGRGAGGGGAPGRLRGPEGPGVVSALLWGNLSRSLSPARILLAGSQGRKVHRDHPPFLD